MPHHLVIIGASGHGKVIADIALKTNSWKKISFLDDNESLKRSIGIEVVGKSSDMFSYILENDMIVAVGNNYTREEIQQKLMNEGANIPVLTHPHAVIGSDVSLGIGSVIMAGAVVNCSTVIGRGCIINTGATVDHDNIIEDYVHISPGVHLAGNVKIGEKTWIGIGGIVSNNINICSGCIIGAGAVVIKDITERGTYIGAPVRKIK